MVAQNTIIYNNLAKILIPRIGESSFFNGSVELEDNGTIHIFKASLIIYREPLLDPADPSGTATRITDIVPAWWEFRTFECGVEQPNNFSWSELRKFLLQP